METRECPRCQKRMIQVETGEVLLTYPALYPWDWWCGGCGYRERGGVIREATPEEYHRQRWEEANAVSGFKKQNPAEEERTVGDHQDSQDG
jgi:C4-type Zn-finger protein